jgi:hypothetical protein
MNIAQQKIQLAQRIFLTEDKSVLKEIELLLSQDGMNHEISEEEKEELDRLRKLHKAGKSKSTSMAAIRKKAHAGNKK